MLIRYLIFVLAAIITLEWWAWAPALQLDLWVSFTELWPATEIIKPLVYSGLYIIAPLASTLFTVTMWLNAVAESIRWPWITLGVTTLLWTPFFGVVVVGVLLGCATAASFLALCVG